MLVYVYFGAVGSVVNYVIGMLNAVGLQSQPILWADVMTKLYAIIHQI